MRDDPRANLKWLERELLSGEERPQTAVKPGEILYEDPGDLLDRVDALLSDEPEIPVFVSSRKKSKAARRESAAQTAPKFDESAAVPVKTRKQLRAEAVQRKAEQKRSGVNRSIKGLVLLAALELLGILAVLGWWLQWLI